jgi:hypothetical protein
MKEGIMNFIKSPRVAVPILIYLILLGPILYLYSGSPPKNEITVYKGYWAPIPPTGMTLNSMKEDGMNTICLTAAYIVDSDGNIYRIPFIEKIKIAQIQAAHRKGLRVFLIVTPFSFGEQGGPFIPQNVKNQPELLEGFLNKYNLLVLKWAEIAEKYGVELFTPMNEFDYSIGSIEKASEWGQEILPKVKNRYHGKIVWNGALNYLFYNLAEEFNISNINFTGYDYIGLSILMWDNDFDLLRNNTRRLIETVRGFAQRDGVQGVMITELGIMPVEGKFNLSEEAYAMGYQVIFEEGESKVVGFFTADWPEFLGPRLRGTLREQTIKEWFKEKLP